MLQHLNGRELTGPMVYKDIYVPSNSMLKMPLFRELMFPWCSLILQLHSDSCSQIPLKNKKVGKRSASAVWCPDKERCTPSSLQPSVTDYYYYYLSSAEKPFVSNKYFLSSNAFYICCLYCFIFPLSRLTQSSCILFLPLLQQFHLPP